MATPTTIEIKAGQTLLFYKDSKIVLKQKYDADSKISTSWDFFVGNEDEVNLKIKELSLSTIKKPLTLKDSKVQPKMRKVGILRKLFNYLKQIF